MYLTCAVLLGFVLDWVLGDPNSALHPVCLIGRLITRCERVLRRETVAGVLLWLVVCGVSFAAPLFLLRWLRGVHFWLGFGAETLLCWLIFARKSLADAGRHVYTALDASLDEGRKAVAMYVGRDTGALDREGVIKAAVETIAENTTDGVVAPLAYMLLGGAPLGLLYKAVNTLDSMVGYHSDQYEYLGKFSARMDDIFNFIPARLAAVCLIAGTHARHGQPQRAAHLPSRPEPPQKPERRTDRGGLRGRAAYPAGRGRELFWQNGQKGGVRRSG